MPGHLRRAARRLRPAGPPPTQTTSYTSGFELAMVAKPLLLDFGNPLSDVQAKQDLATERMEVFITQDGRSTAVSTSEPSRYLPFADTYLK